MRTAAGHISRIFPTEMMNSAHNNAHVDRGAVNIILKKALLPHCYATRCAGTSAVVISIYV
jgi:hypothetical protein